jgi:cysteine synthase B
MIYSNFLKTIGKTPLVKLKNPNLNSKIEILAKIEGANPTGSVKDRIALQMIEAAEKSKKLTKDKIIIESSSGNTGISLAMIGAVKDYKIQIVMSKAVSKERRKLIKAYGAELILTSIKEGTAGAIKKTEELIKKNPEKYFYINQHNNPNNLLAHFKNTGAEIWQATEGKITHLVASLGTSGTLMGISRYLKKKNEKIKIISVEPILGAKIQGIRSLDEPKSPLHYNLYNPKSIDQSFKIKTEQAINQAKKIIRDQGILVGMSSGAALFGALKIAKKLKQGKIVVIFPDRGEKYLSTELFN